MSESFKDLFEAGGKADAPRGAAVRVGSKIEGTVAHVTASAVFVDLDGKSQGYFDLVDVAGPDGKPTLTVGEKVTAVVVEVEPRSGQIRLARRFGKDAGIDQLRVAHEQGLPVEGKVVGVNKGGVSVEVGGARCFCPVSQLDVRFVQDASVYLNQVLEFRVQEIRNDKDVVLSRRAILEVKAREQKQQILERFVAGTRHQGRVSQLRDFGAFVDLGDVEGLIPMRELSHDRNAKVADVVSLGDVVDVEVIAAELEPTKKGGERVKLTLSLKNLMADPWDGIDAIAPVGRVLAGQVTRLADFGAFVRIASGVEGLLHLSEVSGKARRAEDVLSVGQQVMVVAKSVDKTKKRLSLALADEGAQAGAVAERKSVPAGAVVTAKVESVEPFGVFAQVDGIKGRAGRGLIPNAELGVAHGVDVRKAFPEGTAVRVKVLEAGDRMRLSIKAAIADEERADFDSFRAGQKASSGMGTLGDLLAKKLKK